VCVEGCAAIMPCPPPGKLLTKFENCLLRVLWCCLITIVGCRDGRKDVFAVPVDASCTRPSPSGTPMLPPPTASLPARC